MRIAEESWSTSRRACQALVLLSALCWSVSGIAVRLVGTATEWQIAFYRALAFLLFVLLVIPKRRLIPRLREVGIIGILGGASLAVCFVTFVYALVHATVANALLLLSAYPIIATVLAAMLLREPMTPKALLAVGIASVGVVIMVFDGWVSGRFFGNVMGLCAALGYALYSVSIRAGKSRDMVPSLIYAGIFTIAVSGAVVSTGPGFVISAHDFALCMALGFIGIGAGFFFFTLGSRGLQTSELTLLSLSEVVLGILWVWILAGERPNASALVGGAFIAVAIAYRSMGDEASAGNDPAVASASGARGHVEALRPNAPNLVEPSMARLSRVRASSPEDAS